MKTLTIAAMLFLLAFPFAKIGFSQATETPVAGEEVAGSTSKEEPKAEDDVSQSTPELALRKFMLAMTVGDMKKLKAVAHPHDGIEVLMPKVKLPAETVAKMKARFDAIKITRLKPDEKFMLPNGQSISYGKRRINEDHAVLSFAGNAFPILAARKDGAWRVNPEPIIAMRQAAKQLMEMKSRMKAMEEAPKKDSSEKGSSSKQGSSKKASPEK